MRLPHFGARVRLWHKTDLPNALTHIRYRQQSGPELATNPPLLLTLSGRSVALEGSLAA
jgi:hypothetical protein